VPKHNACFFEIFSIFLFEQVSGNSQFCELHLNSNADYQGLDFKTLKGIQRYYTTS
jgi:hypothetical protein